MVSNLRFSEAASDIYTYLPPQRVGGQVKYSRAKVSL
jgi:hypothetical protein